MNEEEEQLSLSVIFGNTSRKSRKIDLLTLAENCKKLVTLYGSQKALAKEVGLSSEMIRELMLILKLPKEVQNLVKERKIDSIDVIKQLSELQDKNLIISMAEEAMHSSTKEIRDMIRLIKSMKISPEEARKLVKESQFSNIHIYLIDIDDENLNTKIIAESEKLKIKPSDFVKKLFIQSLNELITNSEGHI